LKLQQPFLKGEDVGRVQEALKNQGFDVEVDDTYGPKTEAAVKQFQEKHGLKADGIVGPATLAELGI
jgi:peptidoglycan hydrolase-like protein with peptidoglycan-binding domain